MKKAKRIYCIEGHWNYGNRTVEPSVEPMLKLLQGMDVWEYARRDCATGDELLYFLEEEWIRCDFGSILYVATHGSEGVVSLSDAHNVTVEQLGVHLANMCGDCLVHFGGCKVMAAPEARLRNFMDNTGAMGVSGYTIEAGWTSGIDSNGRTHPPLPGAPALALELLYFSTISTESIDLTDGRQFGRLRRVADDLERRFPDCGFQMLTRLD